MRRKMVAGNWKMHGTRASVAELIDGLRKLDLPSVVETAVFPSDLFIERVINGLKDTPISVGAQDAAVDAKQGALTGEISSSQLVDAGCKLVLIGHSERRLILGESDETLNRKFAAAQSSGLTPVLCIGETLEQREAGQTLEVVERQLNAVIDEFGIDVFAKAVIAYEPVWAIGAAEPAPAEHVRIVCRGLKSALAEMKIPGRVIYGGTAGPGLAAHLMPDADGLFLGRRAHELESFAQVVQEVAEATASRN